MDPGFNARPPLLTERIRCNGTELLIETWLEPGEGWHYRIRGCHGQYAESVTPLHNRKTALREARELIRRRGLDHPPAVGVAEETANTPGKG